MKHIKNSINWQLFFLLLILCMLSVVCIFPYILSVQGKLLSTAGVPIWFVFVAQFIQNSILFSLSIYFGLLLAKKTGFRLPLFEAIIEQKNYSKVLSTILKTSVYLGIGTAIVIYATDFLFSALGASITTHQNNIPIWQTLLASVYGGISEEILMRLFVMTFFVWISMRIAKRTTPNTTGIIIAIFVAALIFGLGHLPITASLTELTVLIIIRAVLLNGIGGVVFGLLYWKKGLESAMIAHFTADIFLITVLPLLFG